jgi:NADH-quinone oxidoreductase subunit G
MPTIHVDGASFVVPEGINLLHACLSCGLDLPYFCWHPALGSVGACRQCAVVQYQDDRDVRGRLTMACMTPVAEGARFSIQAPEAATFRAAVIEWLMLNHPHDCPVCEEGGECHLQDMTVMTGHTVRRFRGRKRTFRNQDLGPFLNHEMNRCITCYRCVRYYREYAGGTDLQAFGSRGRMYFGRLGDGTLENEFSGNLVEVCPTGVFTDKPFSASYTRKWDLQTAPSVCPGCALGCNTFPAERYGRVQRIHNRYHGAINGYFLCDRGRFGAAFVNSEKRFRYAGVRLPDGSYQALDNRDAIARLSAILRQGSALGIGSPRASLEVNFALRALVGKERFSSGFSAHEKRLIDHVHAIYRRTPAHIPSLREVEAADAVFILGEDVANTAPRLALALRQTVRNRSFTMAREVGIPRWHDDAVRGHAQGARSPLFSATILPTRIDDVATATIHAVPDELARLGFAIAGALDASLPTPRDLSARERSFVDEAARALQRAERPLLVSGTGAASASVLQAVANVAFALSTIGKCANLLLNVAEVNSLGVTLLEGELSVDAALAALIAGEADTLVVVENDLFRRVHPTRVMEALRAAQHVVALDVIATETISNASLVFPAATFAESEGTYVNNETRAQRFYQVFVPQGDIQPAWRWLAAAAAGAGRDDLGWEHIDDLVAACAASSPLLEPVTRAGPGAAYRATANMKIARQPHRYSGRTAMHANHSVHEPKTTTDEESPFSFSMEGVSSGQPSALIPFVWAPGWNSNQSATKFQQEAGGALKGGDPGIRLLRKEADVQPHATRLPDIADQSAPAGSFKLLPLYEIFGSDELSLASPSIAERAPAPYLVLHPVDAERLGVSAGDWLKCVDNGRTLRWVVRTAPAMPLGAAGYSHGLPGSFCVAPEHRVELLPDPDLTSQEGLPPRVGD